MFNKTKSPAPPSATPDRPSSHVPIPPLPDLPSPSQARRPGQPAPAAPAMASPTMNRGLSTLSSDLQFEGNVSGGGDLQVDGSIKGDVRVGRLIVGETGAVEGAVSGDYVEVRGRVVGAVSGKQVKLVGTAYVDGDITADQLSIDIGAFFQGRCIQGRRDAPAQAPTQSAPVFTAPPAPEIKPQIIDMKPA